MRVEDFLRQSAGRTPGAIAVAAGKRRRLTYAELLRLADRAAGSFRAHGINPDERVVLYMDDTLEATIAMFAIWMAGAVVVRAAPALCGEQLNTVLDVSGATGLITEARLAHHAAHSIRGARKLKLLVLAGGAPGSPGDTCLAFEDAIRGTALGSDLAAQLDEGSAAVEIVTEAGATDAITHRDAVAAMIRAEASGGTPDPRIPDALAAIRSGGTLVVADSSGHLLAFAARSRRADEAFALRDRVA